MMEKIKAMVSQEEIVRLDMEVKKIYDVEYDNNYSTAFNLGFGTVANLNCSGFINLIRIVDNLNGVAGEAEFAEYVLKKVFDENKIKELKKELLENRSRYISILYL